MRTKGNFCVCTRKNNHLQFIILEKRDVYAMNMEWENLVIKIQGAHHASQSSSSSSSVYDNIVLLIFVNSSLFFSWTNKALANTTIIFCI